MKKTFLFILGFLFLTSLVWGQTTTTIDFETADDGYTASDTEGSGFTDVFNRDNYILGGNSTYKWCAEDFLNVSNPSIVLDQIDVTGASSFTFSIDMIAHHYDDWDSSDELLITYSIDGGTYQNLMWVQNTGETYNDPAALDTDFDDDGECANVLPALTMGTGTDGCVVSSNVFETFTTSAISISSNLTLDITLQFNGLTSGDEGIYLDEIVITTAVSGGVVNPTAFTATESSTTQIDLAWTENASGNDVLIAWNSSDTFGTPIDGTSYSSGTGISGGGTSLGTDSDEAYSHTPLSSGTQYFYKIWSVDGFTDYSSGVTADATTLKAEPTNHVTGFTATADGISAIVLAWTENDGSVVPDGYLIKASTVDNVSAPVDGTEVADNLTIGNDSGAVNMAHGTTSYNWSGLEPNTAYYFEIYPYTNSGTAIDYKTDGTIPGDNDTTDNNITTIPYIEIFTPNLGDCYTYSVSGDTKEWYWNTGGYAAMSGYNSGDDEEDWLVLPGINLDNYSDEIMTFDTSYNYGTYDANNYLKLYYSTNYTGIGDPTSSAWTEIIFTLPTATNTLTSSGILDLSAITGTSVWIAFKYLDDVGTSRNWDVDNISIAEVSNFAPVISNIVQTPLSNIGTSTTVSVSADVTDSDGTITSVKLDWGTASGSLTNDITMSNSGGDTYTTISDIPTQSEGTTVYYEVYAIDDGSAETTSDEASYFVSDAVAPGVGDLLITEVVGDGADGLNNDNGFMEIFNTTSDILLLANVQARYFNSNPAGPSFTLNLSGTIAAGAYIIITQDETVFNTTYAPTTADFSGSLFYFNGGDDGVDLYLTTARAETLDEFNDNGVDGTAFTWNDDNVFERTSTGDGALYSSWTEITTGIGTPGADNDNPVAVYLSSFYALFSNDLLILNWTTESELNNLGWNIYRGLSNNLGQALQLNGELIPGAGSSSEPTDYSYTDVSEVENNTSYWYWLESRTYDGETDLYGPVSLTVQFEDEEDLPPVIPDTYGLYQNYPNPFNPSTLISFTLEEESDVELIIYNIKGKKIRAIYNDHISADQVQSVVWDGNDASGKQVSSGVYFYKLITDTKEYQKKMLLVK